MMEKNGWWRLMPSSFSVFVMFDKVAPTMLQAGTNICLQPGLEPGLQTEHFLKFLACS